MIKNKKALTLIEILIVTAIFSVVVAALYAVFLVGNKSWVNFNNNVTVQREARNAIINMTKDFREGHSFFITKDPSSISLRFIHPKQGLISYTWTELGENAHRIIRQTENRARVVGNHISELSFEYLTPTVVVELKASIRPKFGDAVSYSLKEKITLRSKIEYESL